MKNENENEPQYIYIQFNTTFARRISKQYTCNTFFVIMKAVFYFHVFFFCYINIVPCSMYDVMNYLQAIVFLIFRSGKRKRSRIECSATSQYSLYGEERDI